MWEMQLLLLKYYYDYEYRLAKKIDKVACNGHQY